MSLTGEHLARIMLARMAGEEVPLLKMNGGVQAPTLVRISESVPQGYQNVDTPDYRLNKGVSSYVGRHEKELEKNPPWRNQSRFETDVERARARAEFTQSCRNTFRIHIQQIKPKKDPRTFRTYEYQKEILKNVRDHQVSLILGKTGCGKSSQVPQYILRDCAMCEEPCRIFVTQPRRVAARQAALFVARSTGWPLGDVVGYQVGGEKDMVSDLTILRFVTPGVLLRQIIGRKTNESKQMTHLIIDEVHERTAEMDMLLTLARRRMVDDPDLKIILMSATFNENLFRNFFLSRHFHDPRVEMCVPSVKIETEEFKVKEFWLETYVKDIDPLFKKIKEKYANVVDYDAVSLEHPRLVPWVVDIALEIIKMHSLDNECERRLTDPERESKSILVFLPGYGEILDMADRINELDPVRNKWDVILLHSRVRAAGEQKVFDRPRGGHRKIILSTNLAESSITIEDVRYIIDFGLTKRNVVDKDINLPFLRLEWCSQAEIKQRTGRAGRVQSGKVYHMIPSEFYYQLPQDPPPEITRGSLTRLVLAAKLAKVRGDVPGKFLAPKEIFAETLSPPNEEDIDRAILTLKELGGLTLSADGRRESPIDRYDGVVTDMGRFMNSLPIDLHLSRLTHVGCALGMPREAVAVAALLSFENVFLNIAKGDLKHYHTMLYWSNGTFSDVVAFLRLYEAFRGSADRRKFCHELGLDHKVLMEVLAKEEELLEILDRDRWYDFGPDEPDAPVERIDLVFFLKIVVFCAFYPNYFVSDEKLEKDIHNESQSNDPLNSVYLKRLPLGVYPKADVYADQIRKRVELVSDEISLNFQDSKAFVTFGPTRKPELGVYGYPEDEKKFRKVSVVNTSVYLALKAWATRRNSMKIRIFSHDRANAPLRKKIKLEEDEDAPVKEIPEKNFDRLRRMLVKADKTDMGALNPFDVQVLAVDDPGLFWVRCRDETVVALRQLLNHPSTVGKMKPLQRKYLQPGTCVLAQSEVESAGKSSEYCRGVILSVKVIDGQRMALVRLVDVSTVQLCPVETLKAYSKKIVKCLIGGRRGNTLVDRLAFRCSLANVAPYHLTDNDFKYPVEAAKMMKDLAGKNRVLAILYSVEYGVAKVFLELGKGPDAVELLVGRLHTYLKDKGLACAMPESIMSQRDYELFRDRRVGSAASDTVSVCERDLVDDDGIQLSGLTVDEEEEGTEVIELGGPFSPLQLAFRALSYKEREREVLVAADSVNCVALDPFCGRGGRQVLVAGQVALDASQMKLHARCTTAFSWKPGTHLLLSILFAPTVEFRVDKTQTRITGALCGLGYTRDGDKRPVAVYPDHDMEINADVEVTMDDICAVNRMRSIMNRMLMPLSTEDPKEKKDRSKSRKVLRSLIKEYLDCPRMRFNAWKGPELQPMHYPNHWDELGRAGIPIWAYTSSVAADGVVPTFDALDVPKLTLEMSPSSRLAHQSMHCAWHRIRIKYQGALHKQIFHCTLCQVEVVSGLVGRHINEQPHKDKEMAIKWEIQQLPVQHRKAFEDYWEEVDVFKMGSLDRLIQWDALVQESS